MAKKRGREKGEQQFIEGMAPEKHPRIHKLAVSYVRARDARMGLTTEEVAAHDLLLSAMQDEGMTEYEYGDIKVKVRTESKVKVKQQKDDQDQEGEE